MADINIFINKGDRNSAWMIAETKQGEKWMRKNFSQVTAYIPTVEVESFVRTLLDEEQLSVEVY